MLSWLAVTLALGAPGIIVAQSTAKADTALKQIDDNQCDAAIDTINQGMRDGEPKAFYIAGQLFENGFCLVANKPRAMRLYERGALLGDRESACSLALLHARGDGVPQSYREAGRWYAVMRRESTGTEAASAEAFAAPDVLVRTYIEAVRTSRSHRSCTRKTRSTKASPARSRSASTCVSQE